MSDGTKIEWADATANYVNGCSVVSPGCTNCYAMRLAGTRMKDHPTRAGLTMDTKAGPVWTGEVRRNERVLKEVLGWRKPRRIFWNAHGDLFHENVPDAWIDRAFAVMALTPQHTHMVLTKRPARMADYVPNAFARIMDCCAEFKRRGYPWGWDGQWPFPNVWLGTSVEDQTRADERITHLLATPTAVRFISAEPLLGPVDLRLIDQTDGGVYEHSALHWIIVGGESGPGARPMHADWVRSLRDQCAAAGVPFFFKQWGEWGPQGTTYSVNHPKGEDRIVRLGKARAGNTLDGRQHLEWPA